MLRVLLQSLAVLHLGPALAFALIAFACEGSPPYPISACESSTLGSFAWLTVAVWLLLAVALATVSLLRRARNAGSQSTGARVWALAAVVALGSTMSAIGYGLTGSQFWFLALPAVMAVAWLVIANPQECQAAQQAPASASGRPPGPA